MQGREDDHGRTQMQEYIPDYVHSNNFLAPCPY
jgi:hypothetical protein